MGPVDGRDRVVASVDFEAFSESLLDNVAFDVLESREGGASGNVAAEGDWSLDDGTDTTTGDDTDVPPGLRVTASALVAALFVPAAIAPSALPVVCSLTPPTDARRRLYSPLRPPCTRSIPLGSSSAGPGGAVRSSKVVSVSERDAVACIWWSASSSEFCELPAIAVVFVLHA